MNRAPLRLLAIGVTALSACDAPTAAPPAAPPAIRGPSRVTTWDLQSTIAFSSTRDNPSAVPPFIATEIYLIDADGSNPRRLTFNDFGDAFANLSPDGKKIVFDSNRLRTAGEPINTSDLFVMERDGSDQRFLIRGSSASWSPDGKRIAFHASASGMGLPIKTDPGAATFDSDIFIANVDDLLAGTGSRTNLTNNPLAVDDDPDWSPNGDLIAFTSHSVNDNQQNSTTAEIYVIKADGTGQPVRLTFNSEEERAPAWSPDGTRIVYMCRRGNFEICLMNADGSGQTQLTSNAVFDATPTWSPDGTKIVFGRFVSGGQQLFEMNPDGTGQVQITNAAGTNLLPHWGALRVKALK
jgi:TolB protein